MGKPRLIQHYTLFSSLKNAFSNECILSIHHTGQWWKMTLWGIHTNWLTLHLKRYMGGFKLQIKQTVYTKKEAMQKHLRVMTGSESSPFWFDLGLVFSSLDKDRLKRISVWALALIPAPLTKSNTGTWMFFNLVPPCGSYHNSTFYFLSVSPYHVKHTHISTVQLDLPNRRLSCRPALRGIALGLVPVFVCWCMWVKVCVSLFWGFK